MRYQWRLVLDPPMSGLENMEKDLDLMGLVAAGECPPTLRIYRWDPPAVSLGYFQDENEVVDLQACRRAGLDLVRRPTGGRAVIHDQELTYSIVVPEIHPFIDKGGVVDAYRSISRGIVTAFNLLNIVATVTPEEKSRAGIAPGSCFDSSTAYEIQIKGKKVVGSAQLRRDGIVLQHGSILFKLPVDLYRKVLKTGSSGHDPGKDDGLGKKAAGLLDLGYRVSYSRMTRALVKGFSMIIPAVFTSLDILINKKGD